MNRLIATLTLFCGALLANEAHAQDPRTTITRINPARAATVEAAVNPAAAVVNPVATAVADNKTVPASRYSRSVNQAQRDLIASGQLRAVVSDNSSVVVSSHAADEHALRNGVFLQFVRAKPEVVQLPVALQSDGKPGETATVLRQELTVPGAGGQAVRLSAFVRNSTGLSYVGARNRFEGKFAVALGYADGSPQVPLTEQVSIAVTAPGAESLDPPEMRLMDVDAWHGFGVAVRSPGNDYEIKVSAGAKDAGNSVKVPVLAPKVNLATSVSGVTGFGLGTFDLAVAATGIAEPEGAVITFNSDGAAFENGNTVKLDANGTGTLKMRSTSSGMATISAMAPFESSSVTIKFRQPWLILLLAFAGGVLGALVTGNGKGWGWLRGGGVGVGLAILYYVGIDWLAKLTGFTSLAKAGEFVAVALGFIGSIVDVKWLQAEKPGT